MSRYIDADALSEDIWSLYRDEDHIDYNVAIVDALNVIDEQPTADVIPIEYHERCLELKIKKQANMVEVVRCKDCDWFIVNEIKADGTTDKRYKPTWCTYHNGYMNDDDFCSYGERREDDKE